MTGPAPAVAAARRAVRLALADLAAVAGPADARAAAADVAPAAAVRDRAPLVLVACSGGADSLALAAAAGFVAPRLGLRAGAVVVDHGMQTGSADGAPRAAHQCRALDLSPVVVRRVDARVAPGAGGPESVARAARYAALHDVAAELGADALLVGHTLDDQAESVLLGLARGSGSRSLAAMRTRAGLVRRPFLGLRRADTEAVCADVGVVPWDDPTNDGTGAGAPLRSRVRSQVLPLLEDVLGPGVAQALARTAEQAREDDDALTALAEELLGRAAAGVPGPGGPGVDALSVEVLAASPDAVRRRCLRRALVAAGCPAGSLTRAHVLEVDRLVTAWRGQGPLHLPGAVGARRDCGRLVLTRPHP